MASETWKRELKKYMDEIEEMYWCGKYGCYDRKKPYFCLGCRFLGRLE